MLCRTSGACGLYIKEERGYIARCAHDEVVLIGSGLLGKRDDLFDIYMLGRRNGM